MIRSRLWILVVLGVVGLVITVGVVRGRDERLAEEAAGEHGDVLVEDAAEVEQATLADEGERLEALRLVHVVEHAELILGSERGGHSDDQGVEKLGKSVSPPSTKIVCPVM